MSTSNKLTALLPYLAAITLLSSAVLHIISPDFFRKLTPPFFPFSLANWAAIFAETGVAILLIIPRSCHLGGLFFMLMMIAFLPLHVWDVFRDDPAIPGKFGPEIRLVFQFVLIFIGWKIWTTSRAEKDA